MITPNMKYEEAIYEILNYMEKDERRNYEEVLEDMPNYTNHVYVAMTVVRNHLKYFLDKE